MEEAKGLKRGVRATEPVHGIADSERDPIENSDCVSDLSAHLRAPESYSTYEVRVYSIIKNTTTGTEVVNQLQSLGSEVFHPKKTWSRCLESNLVNRED